MELLKVEKKLIKIIKSCSTNNHIDCARVCVDNAKRGNYLTKEMEHRVEVNFHHRKIKIMGECYAF